MVAFALLAVAGILTALAVFVYFGIYWMDHWDE
jgi:hypothetical protein